MLEIASLESVVSIRHHKRAVRDVSNTAVKMKDEGAICSNFI
jgi:hypothetical protein